MKLWCSRLQQYCPIDNFSAKNQKEPDDSKRFSMRDAVHYKLVEKFKPKRVKVGDPVVHTWGRVQTGKKYYIYQETDPFGVTDVQYDDKKSWVKRLDSVIDKNLKREKRLNP